jgi:hypothetical protein
MWQAEKCSEDQQCLQIDRKFMIFFLLERGERKERDRDRKTKRLI